MGSSGVLSHEPVFPPPSASPFVPLARQMSHSRIHPTQTARPGDRAGLLTLGGAALLVAAFLLDALTGAFPLSVHADGTAPTAYVLLALGTSVLAPGLAGTAMTYRRRFGPLTHLGLVTGAVGFLLMTVGAALNFTPSASAVEATTGSAVVFGGIALSALAALVTGFALWRIDVTRRSAAVLLTAFAGFVAVLVVGESVATLAGFDLGWSVFGVLLAAGWASLGNYVRTRSDAVHVDRASAPV